MKLSICIATLNRAAFIGATLDSIVSQLTDEVEVVIVDGASTDNTEEIVKSYQGKNAGIGYVGLPVKGGLDQDYAHAVELARGEYCWLFSDDDVLLPGAINAVLSRLHVDLDLIIVNAEVRSSDLMQTFKPRALEVSVDKVYEPEAYEEFFGTVANYLSFIGCVVIRKACWSGRDTKSYFGSWFVHMGVIFQRPLTNKALVLEKPWIAIRYGNAMWSSNSFRISLFKWPELIWSFSEISEDTRQKVTPRDPWRSEKRLLIFRARGAYGRKEYLEMLEGNLQSISQRAIAYAIAIFPGAIANAALCAYFTVFRTFYTNAQLQLSDLRSSGFHYRKLLMRLFGMNR
jgi:abequosyltransferase